MMSIRSLADFNRSSLGGDGDWLTPSPSPPRPHKPGRHGERGMGTFNWPPARTSTWPYTGTFSWPRTSRLTRAFVLAVTIPPSPHLEMQVEQRLHYGRVVSGSGFWRWRTVIDRNVPRLLRRWGPAPSADGRRIEPPLRDEDLRLRGFRSVATVL